MKNDRRRKEMMSAKEWKRIEAKETREMDAASPGRRHLELASTGRARWRCRRQEGKFQRDVTQEALRHMGQSWDSSQMEDELEERDATDWLAGDEMTKQWEEVSNEE